MKHIKLFLAITASALSSLAFPEAKGLQVFTSSEMESTIGPKENFSGKVKVTRFFQAESPATVSSALVEFDSGVRSNWHTHPKGQTLIVTKGTGRVQEWGKEIKEIKEGDVIWTPPGVKHWHGGGESTPMSHIAIQESLDGKTVQWMEAVTEKKNK